VTPQRVQLRRTKGWRLPPETVVVSRPGPLGNPFDWRSYPDRTPGEGGSIPISDDDRRAQAVEDFRAALAGRRAWPRPYPELAEIRSRIAGQNLACWCAPGAPCHADVLLELANREGGRVSRVERIGDCTLYLGDCREVLPVLGKVDAVVTDPPYGQALANHAHGGHSKRPRRDYAIANDDRLDLAHEVLAWARETAPSIVAFADPDRPWAGRWRSRLVWDKGGAVGGGGDPATTWKQTWELIQVWNRDALCGGRDSAVLKYWVTPQLFAEHPAAKPIALLRYLIEKVSGPAGLVADPFMGSGSTGVAAVASGRGFVGCELVEGHFDTACRRIEEACRQPRLEFGLQRSAVQPSFFQVADE
jgi:site-specific DNA-methyltransferase (adenine-specific)